LYRSVTFDESFAILRPVTFSYVAAVKLPQILGIFATLILRVRTSPKEHDMFKHDMKTPTGTNSKFGRNIKTVASLGLLAATLSGCVVYPNGGYYGGGYGYAPAPAYYAPPVAFDFGFGGGYYGHRGWR
jgi:hypothetical protein